MADIKLCIDCKHHSLMEPDPHPDQNRKHWCTAGLDLVTGAIAYCPCGTNRTKSEPFWDQWGGSNAMFDPCGHQAKYFAPKEV